MEGITHARMRAVKCPVCDGALPDRKGMPDER